MTGNRQARPVRRRAPISSAASAASLTLLPVGPDKLHASCKGRAAATGAKAERPLAVARRAGQRDACLANPPPLAHTADHPFMGVKLMVRRLMMMGAAVVLSLPAQASGQEVPRPILQFRTVEQYSAGGKDWVRYQFEVSNRGSFPAALFVPAPTLPPCGKNAQASRTWVDFFSKAGKRLYGFCGLSSPENLGSLWFAEEAGVEPPRWVYIEILDRQTQLRVRSNLALVP
jgi:hypothetical protein